MTTYEYRLINSIGLGYAYPHVNVQKGLLHTGRDDLTQPLVWGFQPEDIIPTKTPVR